MKRFFVIFSILLGISHIVSCENHSVNHSNFQLNHKTELGAPRLSHSFKGNLLDDSLTKQIKEKRRIYNEDEANSAKNTDKEENSEFFAIKGNNFSDAENGKSSDWGNLRFQFPLSILEHSHNFPDASIRQPFVGVKHPNHRHEWEKKSDVFEKTQTRWNEEKNFRDFHNQDMRTRNHFNGKYGVINDHEMDREDRRGDIFDRRISITTLNDGEVGTLKNHNHDRAGSIHSGHSNMKYFNRHSNKFWNPHFFKPEKEVVINLKTECSTPREINNQLVHKFIYTPKSPLNMQSGFLGYQIPESDYISSHKMTPMYYL